MTLRMKLVLLVATMVATSLAQVTMAAPPEIWVAGTACTEATGATQLVAAGGSIPGHNTTLLEKDIYVADACCKGHGVGIGASSRTNSNEVTVSGEFGFECKLFTVITASFKISANKKTVTTTTATVDKQWASPHHKVYVYWKNTRDTTTETVNYQLGNCNQTTKKWTVYPGNNTPVPIQRLFSMDNWNGYYSGQMLCSDPCPS